MSIIHSRNEHLDKDMTQDMNILYAFHNLWGNLDFSIFDPLWVQNFNVEITVENDYDTLPENYIAEDIDWD